jgi:hypothetical protein
MLHAANHTARTIACIAQDFRFIASDAWQAISYGVASAAERAS